MQLSIDISWDFIRLLIVLKLLIEAYRAIKEAIKPDPQNPVTSAPKVIQWWTELNTLRIRASGAEKWLAGALHILITTLDDLFASLSFVDEIIGKYLKRLFTLASRILRAVYSVVAPLFRIVITVAKNLLYLACFVTAAVVFVLYVFSPLLMYNLTSPANETYWQIGLLGIRLPPMSLTDVAPRLDTTALTLLGIVVVLGLFTLISEVKVFDVLEIKRNLSSFKKEVDDKVSYLTAALTTIVQAQSLLQSYQQQQTQVTHNVFLDTGLQTIVDLQEKIKDRLGLSSDSINEIRLRDLPSPMNPVEGVSALFRLRFLIEEKLKGLAVVSDIPSTQNALTLTQALKERGLYRELARSVENILRITDEVAGGIQLTPQQTEMILASGASTLAALEKTRSRWEQQRSQKSEGQDSTSALQPLESTNGQHESAQSEPDLQTL